jgi:DegV family protein with EDD domain
MGKMRIVTGSNHALPKSIIGKYNIKVIPFRISFGEKEYLDGADITPEEFLEKLKKTRLFPKAVALSIGELTKAYQELLKEKASTVFSIHMSSHLGASFNAAKKAKELVKADVEVIDTRQVLGGVGLVILGAVEAIKKGKTKGEILQIIEKVRDRTNSVFVVPDLMHLYRGGRIGRAKSLLGSIMKIMPVIALRNGEGIFSPLGKARNLSQANEKIIETIKSDMKRIGARKIRCIICDADNKVAVNELKKALKKNFECEITDGEMPCCGIVYLGHKAWGVSYYLIK